MQKKKAQDEVQKEEEEEEEDVGLSPSHACVSVLVCWGRVSPFHPANQPPSSSTQPCLNSAEPRRLTQYVTQTGCQEKLQLEQGSHE